MRKKLFLVLFTFLLIISLSAQDFIFESFENLDNWDELTFDKIDRKTTYKIVTVEDRNLLKIESSASASGLIYNKSFPVDKFPIVEWKWKAENIIESGDATKKDGDDYPVRIYIIFPYDPDEVGFLQRAAYNTLKAIYGEYPPIASLNYIYANKNHDAEFIPNPFTGRAMMKPVDQGTQFIKEWRTHTVNIRDDYQQAFGKEVPKTAQIAIMGDTDNTGESAVAFIEYIRVFNRN